ncbi:hypothetical protein ACFL6I_03935 [candidate division KSB1 bacterium]
MSTAPTENHDTNNDYGYEKEDVDLKKILIVAGSVILILVVMLIGLYDYFLSTKEAMIYEYLLKPESAKLRDLRAREEEVLHSYKRLDPEGDLYQIPIERAMELIAEEAFQERQRSGRIR